MAVDHLLQGVLVHQTDDLAGPTGYHRFLADSWRTFDLAALGKVADFLSVMSYDQHTRRTPPGPVAGIPWVRSVTEYFLRFMPPEKLSLGIPLYGDYWSARADPTPERARTSANCSPSRYAAASSTPRSVAILRTAATSEGVSRPP